MKCERSFGMKLTCDVVVFVNKCVRQIVSRQACWNGKIRCG